ncbi:hypothetical protein ACVWZ3_008460 [Bradyrhizobium sp. i1.3.6]
MDRLRQQLLAGAGLAGEQHGHALPRRAFGELLGLRDRRCRADEIGKGEARRAGVGQLPPRQPQIALELGDAGKQRLETLEVVVEHEPDRADDVAVLVLDRHARHHELFAAELHDVEQDRLAALGDVPHQAVRDDLLDRPADRFGGLLEAQRRQIFLVDVDHPPAAIDRDRALAQMLQPLEQRHHRPRADIGGIADVGGGGHGVPQGSPPVY